MPFKLINYPDCKYFSIDSDRLLFHYTTADKLNSILSQKSIRFRKNNFSNDEHDGKINGLIEEVIKEMDRTIIEDPLWLPYKSLCITTNSLIEKFTQNKGESSLKTQFPLMFNFCLSLTNDNEEMWKDYAKNEVCIQFSEHFLRRALDGPIGENTSKYQAFCSCDVLYSRPQQKECIKRILLHSYKTYQEKYDKENSSNYQEVFHDVALDFLLCSYVFKNELSWSHEKEVRFFLVHDKRNYEVQKQDGIPFIELSFMDNPDIWNHLLTKIWVKTEEVKERICGTHFPIEVL